ncbi:IclR family transcriptional regulator [Phenylobacterium hankyongense]|uniref:IclR family transcriptional regulator n=1 Tax=Phenylobacterium hankyongense TaxID=1813876 RepID=A0A328B0R9_9CAUL|nr:IclR family transcriptional regulator [Phenylobacterium hankyongense]RAK60763.1 IclR family transcriptional regulator [Phenylobacterium hankyongense]
MNTKITADAAKRGDELKARAVRALPNAAAADTSRSPRGRTESDPERSGGRSVARTCAILRLVGQGEDEGVSLLDVAAATELPKSSAHRYLQVLEAEGFVERDARSSRYRLGIGLMALQTGFVDRLIQRTRPFLAKVRDRYDETVNLGMLVGHQIVYLDILESARTMRLAARRGDTESIHATALGKAIAAHRSDQEVLALLRRGGMPRLTGRTITEPEEFLRELERVRASGYAVDDRENEPEGRCVAVFVPGLSTPTAISLSGVASRFPMEKAQEVADSLRVAAMEISGENIAPIKPLAPTEA